jgi:hypothetical protein
MGRAMDRISQVPPESTRQEADASTLRFLSVLLVDENMERENLKEKEICITILYNPLSLFVQSLNFRHWGLFRTSDFVLRL